MRKLIPILFIGLFVIIFFWQFFIKGLFPIPADTIIGLYHPFRDLYSKDYPNGIPFKNFLITDPVRQQFPWRELAISTERRMELPLWNPYNLAGTPLLGNFQSAPFYIFNVLFFIMPFATSWSLIIFLGPLLGGVFLFLYLDNLRLSKWASVIGAITFAFSGFFVSWMEWGTITHVALWLPLALLSIDKIFFYSNPISNIKYQIVNTHFKIKKYYFWSFLFVFSLTSAFFAGHLQTFFYLLIFSWVYFFARWFQFEKKKNVFLLFFILNSLFLILTSIQWIPTLQLILLSARNIDRIGIGNPGWFIPWQHLIQFVAPDFFGNPTTLNYWGVWNYGEFVGYIGVLSLIMAIFALFFRHDKKTLFYGTGLFASLIFSLPTFLAELPLILNVPFLETVQPTRLLFITCFSLAVLSAFGFDYFLRLRKGIINILVFISIVFFSLWVFVVFGDKVEVIRKTVSLDNLSVAKRNLIFPTFIFIFSILSITIFVVLSKYKNRLVTMILCCMVVGVVSFDLFRFAWKFTPFTQRYYLFPSTKTISFLKENIGEFRFMSIDSRIFPPNFSAIYKLKSVDGYDPLYLLRYGELIAASERGKPDITPPFGFNRIITPKNYESKVIDLLGVKYILSLKDLLSPKLEKVFQEGETRIYENKDALPRVFFVEEVKVAETRNDAIEELFQSNFAPAKTAVIEKSLGADISPPSRWTKGTATIVHYSENKIKIMTENSSEGFLVLTDSYYPTWHALIGGRKIDIYRVDYHFRGVVVPSGKHLVEFSQTLL